MITIKTFLGLLESNTYVVSDESGNGMIIDAGADVKDVLDYVNKSGISIKYLVLTHGHADHAEFIGDYISTFEGAIPVCHENELMVLKNPEANVSKLVFYGRESIYDYDFKQVKDGDTIDVGNMSFLILNTPGHTPGSICLLCEKEEIMFTGDVLFANSYGRTDFLYGSMTDMMDSLRRLYRLAPNLTIYPGHYESTRLSH